MSLAFIEDRPELQKLISELQPGDFVKEDKTMKNQLISVGLLLLVLVGQDGYRIFDVLLEQQSKILELLGKNYLKAYGV